MDAWPIKSFEIDGIHFREILLSDAQGILDAVRRNADHLSEYMHWAGPNYSLPMATEFAERSVVGVEDRRMLNIGIFDGGTLVGLIGFPSFDWTVRKTEIGYWLDRNKQGKGIITRAAQHLVDYAFDELKLNRVVIKCSSSNTRSAAVARRLGFKLEGTLRQSELRNGRLHDYLIFGLLSSDRG